MTLLWTETRTRSRPSTPAPKTIPSHILYLTEPGDSRLWVQAWIPKGVSNTISQPEALCPRAESPSPAALGTAWLESLPGRAVIHLQCLKLLMTPTIQTCPEMCAKGTKSQLWKQACYQPDVIPPVYLKTNPGKSHLIEVRNNTSTVCFFPLENKGPWSLRKQNTPNSEGCVCQTSLLT